MSGSPLHVALEGSSLCRPRAGIGFYTSHLLSALLELPDPPRITVFANRPIPDEILPPGVETVIRGPRSTHLWVHTRLAGLADRQGVDVLHSPSIGIPMSRRGPSVLTVHDLAFKLFPAQREWKSYLAWNFTVPIMARRSHCIIAPSRCTKDDIVEHLRLDPSDIFVVPEAAAPGFKPVEDEERLVAFRREQNLESGYLLVVGTLEPRKNHPFLFRCFQRWLQEKQRDATLVVVGKVGWKYDAIFKARETLRLGDRLRLAGYVEGQETMRLMYGACRGVLYPSLYEGFGLPPLEAMACGAPVAASNRASLPEVVGAAGRLLDPTDEEAWIEALDDLWEGKDREEYVKQGLERAQSFSWKRNAQETLAVYRKAIERCQV